MTILNPRDYYFELSRGTFEPNDSGRNFSGTQSINSNGVEADIWTGVVGNLTWLQADTSIEVLSSDANDSAAGTGARTVSVAGIDINLNPVSEIVTLNGTTPVTLANQYFRVNRGFVLDVGTYGGTNIGNITFRTVGTLLTQAYIAADVGRVAMTHYTVPAGKNLIVKSFALNAEIGKPTDFQFRIKPSLPVTAPYGGAQRAIQVRGVQGFVSRVLEFEVRLPEGIDIWMTATPGTNNTGLFADWIGVQIDTTT